MHTISQSEFCIKLRWHFLYMQNILVDVHHLHHHLISCYSFKHYIYINIAWREQVARWNGNEHHTVRHHNHPPLAFVPLMVMHTHDQAVRSDTLLLYKE